MASKSPRAAQRVTATADNPLTPTQKRAKSCPLWGRRRPRPWSIEAAAVRDGHRGNRGAVAHGRIGGYRAAAQIARLFLQTAGLLTGRSQADTDGHALQSAIVNR
jgi:hypothetical protein